MDGISLAAQHSVPNSGLLSNLLLHLTQVPTILKTFVKSAWIGFYPKDLTLFQETGIDESISTDQNNTKLMLVSNHSLLSLQQLPPMSPDSLPTQDFSLWLLSGALVMGLKTYSHPCSSPPLPGGVAFEPMRVQYLELGKTTVQ
ncbi:hypothetical protein DSO57_1002812 [Entomophthora muscae]|uniref:Uncharacterized protein n=1 Tax=Entomophthora muscae TaxID=34485 RepID=A0ACC2SAG9_9FUNG|nr:hypothetical protein DSO57_1002812 [Entomophthora muscae]